MRTRSGILAEHLQTLDFPASRLVLGRFAAGAWTWRHEVQSGRVLEAPTGRVVIAGAAGVVEIAP